MTKAHLDDLDHAIITQLMEDGRRSLKDIAANLNVSAGTVRNRLSRLEGSGILRVVGFLDLDQAGIHAYATIHVRVSPSRMLNQVVETLDAFPEVGFLATVAGEYNLHVDVQCMDNEHLNALLHKRIHTIEGVADTKTTMMLKIHKYSQTDLEALRISAENLRQ